MPRNALRLCAPALVLLAALAIPGGPAAAGQGDYSIRFSSGIAIPMGSFGSDWKSGVPIGLNLAYGTGKHTDLALDMSYRRLRPSVPSTELFGVKDDNIHIGEWRVGGRLRRELVSTNASVVPYAVLGAAIYPVRLVSQDSLGVLEYSSSKLGLNGGLGVDYRISPEVALGLEGIYNAGKAAQSKVGYDFVPDIELTFGLRWIPGGAESGD
ncbi:MAG: outer membrane beta-barrel protein [Hyphomicrobiales bacterium]